MIKSDPIWAKTLKRGVVAITVAAGLSLSGHAEAFVAGDEFTLLNGLNGQVQPPPYGLRLDGLFDGNANTEVTFSFDPADGADMKLVFTGPTPGGAPTGISISGQAFGGEDTGNSWQDPELYNITFTYTGLTIVSDTEVEVTTSGGGAGTGSIQAADGSPADPFDLVAKADTSGLFFTFKENADRGKPFGGLGWVNHSGGGLGNHLAASDWLFSAHPVPEPATLGLMGVGLAALGFAARRRRDRA